MAENFFHFFIKPKPGVSVDLVEKKLNIALDWYRYATGTYIVYTNGDADKWYERLKDMVKDDGLLFICKLDVAERQGWMNKDFWEWLRKER